MKKKHLVFRRMIFDMFRISPGMTTLYCLFDVLHAGGYILVMLCTENCSTVFLCLLQARRCPCHSGRFCFLSWQQYFLRLRTV